MNAVKEFLESLKTDPRAQELIRNMEPPKNDRESLDSYYSIAEKLNLGMSKKDFAKGMKEIALEQMKKSSSAAEQVSLNEADLENVAGGTLTCSSTYEEGEWCWFSDSCDLMINGYYAEYDPNDNRDSFWDPKEGEEMYECPNLAEWEVYDSPDDI